MSVLASEACLPVVARNKKLSLRQFEDCFTPDTEVSIAFVQRPLKPALTSKRMSPRGTVWNVKRLSPLSLPIRNKQLVAFCNTMLIAWPPFPAQDVAVEQLVSRDRRATEMLALLDPSLQSALDVNQEVRTISLGPGHRF